MTFVMSVFTCSKDEDEDTDPEKKADQEQPNQMAHPTAERLDVLLCLLLIIGLFAVSVSSFCFYSGSFL